MDAFDALTQRHGVLRFDPAPVERDLIRRVLTAAASAPSPANTQPWQFVVVDDPAVTRQVAGYLVETQAEYVFRQLLQTPEPFVQHLLKLYGDFAQTPCFILICRWQRTELASGAHHAVVRDWDLCAIGAAMSNLMTAAAALGLGTRWFGNPMMQPDPLRALLNLPQACEIIAVTPLGFHAEPAKPRPVQPLSAHTGFRRGDKYKLAALLEGRLALDDVVHFNKF